VQFQAVVTVAEGAVVLEDHTAGVFARSGRIVMLRVNDVALIAVSEFSGRFRCGHSPE
jgi:hypothetical protein